MLDDASAAIEFYQRALSATELFRIAGPHGRILHAEISIGGAVVMVGDAEPPFAAPTASGSTTVGLHVYLDDVDTASAAVCAVNAGHERLRMPRPLRRQ
jgi:PhnB protein